MEDRPEIAGGSAENPEPKGEDRNPPKGGWIVVLVVAVIVAACMILGFPSTHGKMGSGSRKYARQWKAQLLACHSLDEVKQQFNCIESVPTEGGDTRMNHATPDAVRRPHALIASFADGKWVACAYADSHWGSRAGGGTVVSRDSDGVVRVFFGHVCGDPRGYGKTLEEFYTNLIRNDGMRALRERK